MTDNEIIKALKCCTRKDAKCTDCPAFVSVDYSKCREALMGALDLINRQKAEIERLKIECLTCDAAKVVRCENCKYLIALDDAGRHRCSRTYMTFYPHGIDIQKHYCSLAERKKRNGGEDG